MKTFTSFLAVLFLISCGEKKIKPGKITVPNYVELSKTDVKMRAPIDGDWLKQHKESGQTFNQYLAKNPVTVTDDRNVIYLQPIGKFTEMENKMFTLTTEYVSYFFGLKTVLLEPIPEDLIPKQNRRILFDVEQLDAGYIIRKVLKDKMPSDGIVIMGLTAQDLYPSPDWNFVYGLASYTMHTAVTSMSRFEDSDFKQGNYSLCLNRFIKTSTHEITHMFTVAHCTNAYCLMNGVNHSVELDQHPNALCSVCLAKLSWNLEFDHLKRMQNMISFCKKHKLDSDGVILQKQYTILKQ